MPPSVILGIGDANDRLKDYLETFHKGHEDIIEIPGPDHRDLESGFGNFGRSGVDVCSVVLDPLAYTLPIEVCRLVDSTKRSAPFTAWLYFCGSSELADATGGFNYPGGIFGSVSVFTVGYPEKLALKAISRFKHRTQDGGGDATLEAPATQEMLMRCYRHASEIERAKINEWAGDERINLGRFEEDLDTGNIVVESAY